MLLWSVLGESSALSLRDEAEVTQRLYVEYRNLRIKLYKDLCRRHSNLPAGDLLRYTQIILDRVIFIAFAQSRGLLPADIIRRIVETPIASRNGRIWTHFTLLCKWIDQGNEAEGIYAYRCGLFQPKGIVDELEVTDEMCREFAKLAAYDYRDDISVGALGHIFEQSITDLEELRGSSNLSDVETKPSRRKTEGIFYTPAFVTRYIVDQTLGKVFEEHWNAALAESGTLEKNLKEGSSAWTNAWTATYEKYRERIKTICVLDLSCGSGAFLIAAFDALAREYERVNAELAALNKGQVTIFDLTITVLNNNLFGVDVNAESVEITKLSLWLKTAERGRKLTYLDSNIKWGNSIVGDPMVDSLAFDWKTGNHVRSILDAPTAPEAAEIDARWKDGFDVVIGNPPYVRQELLTNIKDHLAVSYRTYHGMADLFVYFFERGISVLKPGGRMGFIVANKWLRGGYAEPLRGFLASETMLETIVDFGHAPIFPDADAFPSILTLKKTIARQTEHDVQVTMFPREELKAVEIPEYVSRHRYPVPQARFGGAPWSLEPPALEKLMAKIRAKGIPLSEYAGVKPYYGIKTGCNEAFVVDTETRNRLVKEDPKSDELLKKYLRGQDIDRWAPEWAGQWMILSASSSDRDWPWKGLAEDAAEKKFAATYPAVHRQLKSFEEALRKRSDQGKYWWELRPCAYYEAFGAPKLFYPDIMWRPGFCVDHLGSFTNNTVYILPSKDAWLAAVLNSPLLWAYCWRHASHGKDEALRLFTEFMSGIAIAPPPSEEARSLATDAVTLLTSWTQTNHASRAAVLDSLRMQFAVTEPGNKLAEFDSLTADEFAQEVLKRRPKKAGKLKAADMKALREMYDDEAVPMQKRKADALVIERKLAALVNEAYGLTPEDVALLWDTAPPRMPFSRE